MDLLNLLTAIPSPPGDELAMRDFIISYFQQNEAAFRTRPRLIYGEDFQNCLVVQFGKPRTAVFAHMDTVAYMAGYRNNLLEMGSPEGESGTTLTGQDSQGDIECTLVSGKNKKLSYQYHRPIEPGTQLTYKPYLADNELSIEGCYLDNRAGIYNALKLAETMENGMLVFTCWEEHSGGSVGYMGRYIFETHHVRQALISDVTWASEGVQQGKGAVISLRDAGIPRRAYVQKIMALARESGIPFQVEVEQYGSSDGGELQRAPYPIDWCFIGPPLNDMHSPREKLYKNDLGAVTGLYRHLMAKL